MKRYIVWVGFLFVVWLALTMSWHWQELVVGLVVAASIAALQVKVFKPVSNDPVSLGIALRFLPYFLGQLIIANLQIAKLVLSPKINIAPGIISLPTQLKSKHKRFILANAITLTPGTLTLDCAQDQLWVHWVHITEHNNQKAAQQIKGGFEQILAG
jgi:multicomponent Na+:H+ antiporter subunit E